VSIAPKKATISFDNCLGGEQSSDMKVRIQWNENDLFYYPDVMISHDQAPLKGFFEENQTLITEVLSPSTESLDKLEKPAAYTCLPTVDRNTIVVDPV
jgi:Uma2 family endonuclease